MSEVPLYSLGSGAGRDLVGERGLESSRVLHCLPHCPLCRLEGASDVIEGASGGMEGAVEGASNVTRKQPGASLPPALPPLPPGAKGAAGVIEGASGGMKV